MAKTSKKKSPPSYEWVFGIDPGLEGAVALIDQHGDAAVRGFRDLAKKTRRDDIPRMMAEVIARLEDRAAIFFVEHSYRFSKLSENTGRILGVLGAIGVNYQLVRPAVWKRHFGLIGQSKEASIKKARKLFPKVEFSTHDEAEALLIAEYGRRKVQHEE